VHIPFRLVDVFTERPLAGNQLCVVPDGVEVPDGLMQALAQEIGFSETTFVTAAEGTRYRMRIFTPAQELPFAGHPTLGTAYVLASEGRIGPSAVQEVAAGEFRVEVNLRGGRAKVLQHPPEFGTRLDDRPQLSAAVGLEPEEIDAKIPAQAVSTGLNHLIVPARDTEAVVRAVPQAESIARLLAESGAEGLYLFTLTEDGVKARMFVPDVGVIEDPATGSAAGPLGAYLVRYELHPPGRIVIRQGAEIGRPSVLYVEVVRSDDGWEIWVEGGIAIVGSGAFEV
jgi:trans-2,3-dihydro-3-hydroxyanthranilate isomerase